LKLLLTSGGVTNPSIRDALVDLLGKPAANTTALCIPTAQWATPGAGRSQRGDSSAACPRGVA
jgi:dipeptidase E